MNNLTQRSPVNGTFELTGRCNLSCRMCLVRVDARRMQELKLRERTAQEWIDMAGQAAKAGTLGLLLTGGEVLLRPDFCDIYAAIAKMGFILTVYTNATLVTDQVMDLFRAYPPHKIGVTMYGASNATYEKLCGCPDGYDRFVAGLDRLATLPSLLETRTTIVQDNWADLEAMQQFTKEQLGPHQVLHISCSVVDKIRDGIACPKECRLPPRDHTDLLYPGLRQFRNEYLAGRLSAMEGNKSSLVLKRRPSNQGYLFQDCRAGIQQYAINWAGRMYACELLSRGYTLPFEEGFQSAWERLPEQYPSSHSIPACENCDYACVCDACPAVRLAETGDWFGVPSYVCSKAKDLYQLLCDIKAFKQQH